MGVGAGGGTFAESLAGGSGALFHLRGGYALLPQLQLGVEFSSFGQYNTWAANEQTGGAVSSLMGQATFFLSSSSPISLSAGFGWGSGVKVDRVNDDTDGDSRFVTRSASGTSWMAGAGYDLHVGDVLRMTAQARYDGAALGSDLGSSHVGSLNLIFGLY
jgi:hypothetical protein